MRSILEVAVIAISVVARFTLDITSPDIYKETYITADGGHVGVANNPAFIGAAPVTTFTFVPASNGSSLGTLINGDSDGQIFLSCSQNNFTNVWELMIGTNASDFTFGEEGALVLPGYYGRWMICDVTLANYGNITFVNYFNGTGTPDNPSCINTTIVRGTG